MKRDHVFAHTPNGSVAYRWCISAIGRQLLAKLNIPHEELSKKQLDDLVDTLVTLYQDYNTPKVAPDQSHDS